ncbi:tyrosine-type recombinase/integrase [Acinetobacter baumannii]|uniref:tyrosine-type recombinase/integrase n=1 Tax=Acinetobacter baumannii TaxID=470 RepID=UPI000CE39214|nr:site-specific integrase [Acinetobacter baumannii]EKV6299912.1 integrase arm-type DNA-binding domain-containing protein [Acinetobacter baumannii]EKW9138853.1 integrase arm-type DNA-binding domain-containing protein [Acinetobacter baumannii]PPC41400.1 integrase [Acinetobacter baumannii]PPC50858.1 integrase [Acinetobacter baumannii]
MALTEVWLKANNGKARDKVEEIADRDSMSVRISPKGKIVFQLRYRFAGKAERLDLGTYPHMSLKDARMKAGEMRSLLDKGMNPKVEVRVQQQKYIDASTFEEVFNDWYESYCLKKKTSAQQIKNTFEQHVIPEVGDLPVDRITLQQWLALLEELADEVPSIADRVLTNAKQALKWAKKRQLLEVNVLSDIYAKEDLGIERNRGTRFLSDEEIKMVLMAIEESNILPKNKIFLKLCLMFGCRNGELRKAKKTDFDLKRKVWVVPVVNNKTGKKTGREIIRPILPEMEALIVEAFEYSTCEYFLTNDNEETPMSHGSSNSLPAYLMERLRRHHDFYMKHWSLHDLRRTARTNFSAFTSRDVAQLMIGHVMSGEQGTYDYYEYLPQQTEAYTKWLKKLNSLTNI